MKTSRAARTFRFAVVFAGQLRGHVTYSREDGYGAELADGTPLIGWFASRDEAELALLG